MKRCRCVEPVPVNVEMALATVLCVSCGGWLAVTLKCVEDLDKVSNVIPFPTRGPEAA